MDIITVISDILDVRNFNPSDLSLISDDHIYQTLMFELNSEINS